MSLHPRRRAAALGRERRHGARQVSVPPEAGREERSLGCREAALHAAQAAEVRDVLAPWCEPALRRRVQRDLPRAVPRRGLSPALRRGVPGLRQGSVHLQAHQPRQANPPLRGLGAVRPVDRGGGDGHRLVDPRSQHRAGLRRLVGLQIRDALRYLEKNIPDLQAMAAAFMHLGTIDELRSQIVEVALDRAFLVDPLPTDAPGFQRRVDDGRTRLTLIAGEVARAVAAVLADHAIAVRKLRDARPPKEVADDVQAQLARLCARRFIVATPWPQMAHLPRYLKAVTLRLDKLRADPARDAQRLAELRPLEQRYLRVLAERKGAPDARLDEFRWLLEELRVSLFAQELRTPQPVSTKRLEKAWLQLSR